MGFSFGFFDAKNLDRVYTAKNFTDYLSSLVCNGVQDTVGEQLAVTRKSSTQIAIGTGKAWLNGHYFLNDTEYILDVSRYADASAEKYIAVCLCCDESEAVRDCHLEIIEGIPADRPAISYPENSANKTYLTLAAVLLRPEEILAEDAVTDCRDDSIHCGYMKCILGKCGVLEMLGRIAALENNFKKIADTLLTIQRILGMVGFTYPDVDKSGSVDVDDVTSMKKFVSEYTMGKYVAYGDCKSSWKAFAEENGLDGELFPDVTGDGEITVNDITLTERFISESTMGNYTNDADGFQKFAEAYYNALSTIYVKGTGIKTLQSITSEAYEALPEKDTETIYCIQDAP